MQFHAQVLLGNEVLPMLTRAEGEVNGFRHAVEGVAGKCCGLGEIVVRGPKYV